MNHSGLRPRELINLTTGGNTKHQTAMIMQNLLNISLATKLATLFYLFFFSNWQENTHDLLVASPTCNTSDRFTSHRV